MNSWTRLVGWTTSSILVLGMVACNGGGGGGSTVFLGGWKDVYGNPCEGKLRPGCTFYYDKYGNLDHRATTNDDPFYASSQHVMHKENHWGLVGWRNQSTGETVSEDVYKNIPTGDELDAMWERYYQNYTPFGGVFGDPPRYEYSKADYEPFYDNITTEYKDVSYQYYSALEYSDEYGKSQTYDGWAWISQSGVIYGLDHEPFPTETDKGIALNFAGDQSSSENRDSVSELAVKENAMALKAGKMFAQRYALAEDTGIHIAQTLKDFATVTREQKKRARTEKDVEAFTNKLFGIDVGQALAAYEQMKSGDINGVKTLNADVAVYWDTTPEQSARILKNWFKEEMK